MALFQPFPFAPLNNINSKPINNVNNNIAPEYTNNFYTINLDDTTINSNSILFNKTVLSSISSDIDINKLFDTNSIIDMYYIWDEYIYIISDFNTIQNPAFAPFYPIRIYI